MIQDNQDNHGLLFRLLSSYILFLFCVEVITIGISLVHASISEWPARGILGVSLAIALISFFIDKGIPEFSKLLKRLRSWQVPFLGFLGIAGLVYLLLWAAAYIMPDLSWDGNAYHIPAISMWDASGYIHWINTSYEASIINGYPKGAELVSYILVKSFGNSVINAVNLVFLPIGILGIAYLARSLGAGRLLSLCAGAAFLLVPVNINQSVTTYIDTAYAACATGCVALLVHLAKTSTPKWKEIFLFGAAMGLTLSTKSTGVASSALAMFALAIIWIRDIVPVIRSEPKQVVKIISQRIALLLSIILIALAGGGYWYIRNFVFAGSPLYPVGLTILGHTIFPGVSIAETTSESAILPTQIKQLLPILRDFYTWAQGFTAWPGSIKGYDPRLGGLGFLWLFGCIPSIGISIYSFPKLKKAQKRSLLILLGVVGLAFLTTPMNWLARYTIWIYALGLPCFAFTLSRFIFNTEATNWSKRVASAWLVICLCLLLFEAGQSMLSVLKDAKPTSLRRALENPLQPGIWDQPTSYLFPQIHGTILEVVLTRNGTVVIGPLGNMFQWRYVGLVGQLSQPIGARRLVFIGDTEQASELDKLKGAKYILWDETLPLPAVLAAQAKSIKPAFHWLVLSLR